MFLHIYFFRYNKCSSVQLFGRFNTREMQESVPGSFLLQLKSLLFLTYDERCYLVESVIFSKYVASVWKLEANMHCDCCNITFFFIYFNLRAS